MEELVLVNALGQAAPDTGHAMAGPSGVFMLPVRPGVLRAIEGRAEVMAVPGITGMTGFIFAEARTRNVVESALIAARDRLRVVIG
jgi:hypothetical protein